ncbi:MAG: hypothetical protein IJM37_11295 [Lachnospiraceae bacterium]|nr:hypothetical protein [Lachnospiraceae bacterium]
MKKFIIGIILSFIIIGIILCFILIKYSNESLETQITTISKILLQSIVSGFVTFLGLFMTISFNEYQNKQNEKNKICPKFYLVPKERASALKKINVIDEKNFFICTYSKNAREIECEIKNTRECKAKKIFIKKNLNIKKKIKNLECKDNICFLTLGNNCRFYRSFKIFFEDVMGNKYKQKIKYKYDDDGSYDFKSSIPKKRLM